MEDDVRERGAKVGVVYENKKRFELSYQLFGSCPPANPREVTVLFLVTCKTLRLAVPSFCTHRLLHCSSISSRN